MEQEILNKEQQLARALADSAQLRAQLSAVSNAVDNNEILNEGEQKLQKEYHDVLDQVKTLEANVNSKDQEINNLKEKLQVLEDQNRKTISKMEADILLLENENAHSLHETQKLALQISGKNQELMLQEERISNLQSEITALKKGIAKQQKVRVTTQVDTHTKQISKELEMYVQKGGSPVGYERRLANKQKVPQRLAFVTEVDPMTEYFDSNDTVHLPTSFDYSRNGTIQSSLKRGYYYSHHDLEDNLSGDCTQKSVIKNSPYFVQNQKLILTSQTGSPERITTISTINDVPKNFTNMLSRCISWKWRWAAAASQLKALSQELQSMTVTKNAKGHGNFMNSMHTATLPGHDKFISSMQKLGFIHVQNLHNLHSPSKQNNVPKLRQKETKFSVPGHKVISIVLSMWRASIKNAKLEKEAVNKGEKLSRLLSGLPWLIQRFEERRQLERMFHHWALHMLRSKIQMYHASLHSGSWACWQKKPSVSPWTAQLASADLKMLERNGYQGRYMRYALRKHNERQPVPDEAGRPRIQKTCSESSRLIDNINCDGSYTEIEDDGENEPGPSNPKDNRLSVRHNKCLASLESQSHSSKAGPGHSTSTLSCTDDLVWNRRYNVTTFTEKAMQALQVSLYNELQKLQELIVKEARFHQEKMGSKDKENDKTNQEEAGGNGSPFSSSLWRICNGLAHCLIEARDQILALAGNSKSKGAQKTGVLKPCRKIIKIASHPAKVCDKTYERSRVKSQKHDLDVNHRKEKGKGYTKRVESSIALEAGDSEIYEFVGSGTLPDENLVKSSAQKHLDNYTSMLLAKENEHGNQHRLFTAPRTQCKQGVKWARI